MATLPAPPVDGLVAGATARRDAAGLRDLAARAGAGGGDPAALREAAREFEGVFLNQLLKAMRATVPENELFGGGAGRFYRQLHDAELARSLAGHAGTGLADLIVEQLGPPQGSAAPAGPAPGEAAARYRVFGADADAARGRAAVTALARRADAAEADTLRRHGDDLGIAAVRHGVPAGLLLAVVMEESGGDPDAVSPQGARGLTQLLPGTARELGVEDPHRPGPNLAGGAGYLARQLDRFAGRLDLALAAYNAGPAAVERAGGAVPDFPETRRYVERVLARYERLSGGTELANGAR